jgi:hypothetical protein
MANRGGVFGGGIDPGSKSKCLDRDSAILRAIVVFVRILPIFALLLLVYRGAL